MSARPSRRADSIRSIARPIFHQLCSADRVAPSMTDDDRAAIRDHLSVAYVLSPPIPAARGMTLSRQMLTMIGAFIDAGATAVKGESSGIAHGLARWSELASRALHGNKLDRMTNLRRAWVRRPLKDGPMLYSCGMHLIGERDVEIEATSRRI